MQNYQAYAILQNGTEIAGELTLWKQEAIRNADALKNRYPNARVIVVNINDTPVYEAE